MKAKKREFKKYIIAATLSVAIGVFLSSVAAYAEGEPKYVPNEIIVKFKAEAADSLKSPSLDKLNEKYKVKKFAPIFKNFKKDKQRLKLLKTKDKKKLTKKEKHLLRRLKRAPKDARIPDLDRIYKLTLEEGQSVEEIVAEYSKDPNVEYAQPNYIYELYATVLPSEPYIPNDYYVEDDQNPGYWREGSWEQSYPDLWGLQVTQAIEAYNVFDLNCNGVIDVDEEHPGQDIVVAVIDTGIDFTHPDIQGNIWENTDEIPDNGIDDDSNNYIDDVNGYDFSSDDNDPADYYGHGTHCAGTIAARGDNDIGIIGVAPAAKIMPLKIFPYATTETCAQAIRYAAVNGADVLSNSWSSANRRPSDSAIEQAIDDAYAQGCVVVFAAGNEDDDVGYYSPANYEKTIAVAAIEYPDQKASFSNWGDEIDVAAPGVKILSLKADIMGGDGLYLVASGTSMACPHVAGQAAMLLSFYPTLTFEEVRDVIRGSADDIGDPGFDIYYGYGRINLYEALFLVPSSMGRIYLDSARYNGESDPVITATDIDLNLDPGICDTISIAAWTTTETGPETVALSETGPDTNKFIGSIVIEEGNIPVADDGVIVAQHGDTFTVEYYDESHGETRLDTALIDFRAPIINTVEATTASTVYEGGMVTVTWNTDEPATAAVYYGTTPALGETVVDDTYVYEHVMTIKELQGDTQYYFAVESTDVVGNVGYDDNAGSLYSFIIIQPDIDIDPIFLTEGLLENSPRVTRFMTISNPRANSSDLIIEISEETLDWLTVEPLSMTIPSGENDEISVSIDPRFLEQGVYMHDIVIEHSGRVASPITIPVTVNVAAGPAIYHLSHRILDDWTGQSYMVNGDRRLNPGEQVELVISVKNLGNVTAQGVTALLSLKEPDSYVTIIDDTAVFPDIAPEEIVESMEHFAFKIDNTAPEGHKCHFSIQISDLWGNIWNYDFVIEAIASHARYEGLERIMDMDLMTGNNGSFGAAIECNNTGSVCMAWDAATLDDWNVYANMSFDGGATWFDEDCRLTVSQEDDYYTKQFVDVKMDDTGHVYVCWAQKDGRRNPRSSKPNYKPTHQFFTSSDDHGRTWQTPVELNTDPENNWCEIVNSYVPPQMDIDDNGHVYVAWVDRRNAGIDDFGKVYFRMSDDYGHSWQPSDICVSGDQGVTNTNCMLTSDDNGYVYIVWSDYNDGSKLYFNSSNDYGDTWGTPKRISEEPVYGYYSSPIACDNNGNVYTVYSDGWMGAHGLYLARSHDFGATWISDIRMDHGGDVIPWRYGSSPQLTCDANENVYIQWGDYRNTILQVYFNRSHDCGVTWLPQDIKIATDGADSGSYPSAMVSDENGNLHIAWIGSGDPETKICLNYSKDFGDTWLEQHIEVAEGSSSNITHDVFDMDCDAQGNVYIAWFDEDEFKDIYHRKQFRFCAVSTTAEPEITELADYVCAEGDILSFWLDATHPDEMVELFIRSEGLSPEKQAHLATAVLVQQYNPPATEGLFSWHPGVDSSGLYDQVIFVARDSVGHCAYATTRIGVTPPGLTGILPGQSINNVIDGLGSGEMIYIFGGSYQENIEVYDKDIHLLGENQDITVLNGSMRFIQSNGSVSDMTILYDEGEYVDCGLGTGQPLLLLHDAGITAVDSEITVKNCIIQPDPTIFGTDKYGKGIQIWNLYGTEDINPTIENNTILNSETGISLFSQAFGGAILGAIQGNELQDNAYGIALRMHKENPLIDGNTISNSTEDGIYITYDSLLADRLGNISNNHFIGNTRDVFCDELGTEVTPTGGGNVYE